MTQRHAEKLNKQKEHRSQDYSCIWQNVEYNTTDKQQNYLGKLQNEALSKSTLVYA